jgi:hypothetical protein
LGWVGVGPTNKLTAREVYDTNCRAANIKYKRKTNDKFRYRRHKLFPFAGDQWSIGFYACKMGFDLKGQFASAMAIVSKGDLDLWRRP